MSFDVARIHVKGGDGGNGAVSFRREKYVPFGGPDGGDGGRGGSVYLVVNPQRNTLNYFQRRPSFKAAPGKPGRGKDQTGADGHDVTVEVPPGTVVRDAGTGAVYGDLVKPGQRLLVARGGRPGKGNARFATPTNQAPRMATNGEPGEERTLLLELKLIADVGLFGKPNAGKSTFLAATTAARPKIADYPFTTLQPNLGVVDLGADDGFVLADIPGLIEGASRGAGLGHEFLRHVERTRVLIHLVDGASPDPLGDYRAIHAELSAVGHALDAKPQIVCLNKIDLPEAQDKWPAFESSLKAEGVEAHAISAATQRGTREVLYLALQMLRELPLPEAEPTPAEIPVPRPAGPGFRIRRLPDASWRVEGAPVELAAVRSRFDSEEALMRFHRTLEKMGVIDALREAGVKEGDTVWIGTDYELEWRE
ncbi:MAG TPA: GTPase ObgE [Anaerolineae bacterium]|nr:GTPase ObgE [Anaerolineae bacterium]